MRNVAFSGDIPYFFARYVMDYYDSTSGLQNKNDHKLLLSKLFREKVIYAILYALDQFFEKDKNAGSGHLQEPKPEKNRTAGK